MATLLNDALQQAERLAGENRELRRKQEDAVLDKCAFLRFPIGHGLVSCVCLSHSRACQVDADKQQPCSSVWVQHRREDRTAWALLCRGMCITPQERLMQVVCVGLSRVPAHAQAADAE